METQRGSVEDKHSMYTSGSSISSLRHYVLKEFDVYTFNW